MKKDSATTNETVLEAAVNAAASGHDLTGFAEVEDDHGIMRGWQARCQRYGGTVWVGCDIRSARRPLYSA